MRKQFQGNSVKENKEGLEQGEQVERRIERAREIKREREMDSPRPRKKNERGGEKREECDSRRQWSGSGSGDAWGLGEASFFVCSFFVYVPRRWRGVMGGVPSALIAERSEV